MLSKTLQWISTLALLLAVSQLSFAQITPDQMIEKMWKGINLGNTLEAGQEGWWQASAQEFYFDDYVAQEFTSVRVPVRWDMHTAASAPYTIDPVWLARVQEVVDWGLDRDLVIVLNAHHEHWLLDNYTPENITRFEAMWTQIAHHFRNKSENLIFEVINEPFFDLDAAQVDDLNQRILDIIRPENPTRIVILTGGGKNSWQAPLQLTLPDDDYLMAYFHYYVPFRFTSGQENFWGTTAEKSTMLNHFQQVKAWSDANDIPIYLGEFGVDNTVDRDARLDYYHTLVSYATNLGFAWAAWEVGTGVKGFYFREPGSWDQGVLDALIPGDTPEPPSVQNLITNPCFDSNVAEWNLVCGGGSKAALSDGVDGGCACEAGSDSRYLRFLSTNAGNCIRNPNLQYQGPGEYELCFQARTIQYGNSLKARMIVNNSEFLSSDDFVLQTGGEWNTYSYTFTTMTECEGCTFHFQFIANDDNGHYRIDDVSLIKLSDTEAPVFEQCPFDDTLSTDEFCQAILPDYSSLAIVTDNEGVVSLVQEPVAGTLLEPGIHTVTLTAADEAGNTAECSFGVTVADTEAPEAICQEVTVYLDENGSATLSPSAVDNGSYDACGIADLSLDVTAFEADGLSAAKATATTTINAADYAVTVQLNPILALVPADCGYGYSYQVEIDYEVSFTGNAPASGLYTLQGQLNCDPAATFFAIKKDDEFVNNGTTTSGSTTTTTGWNPAADCAAATPQNLGCETISLTIQAPGIPYQVISVPVIYTSTETVTLTASDPSGNNSSCSTTVSVVHNTASAQHATAIPGAQGSLLTVENNTSLNAFPNPFIGQTQLRFKLSESGPVTLEIFNLNGQRVRHWTLGYHLAGSFEQTWNGRSDSGEPLEANMYLVRLTTAEGVMTRKLSLVR